MVSMMGPGLPPLTPGLQDILESSGRLIDKHLQEDRNYLDLSDLLRVPNHSQPSLSGLQDFDYPSLLESVIRQDALSYTDMTHDSLGYTEMSSVKRVPLPPELVEQFGRMQCNCMMGLFPEIERAWLTIDSDIFVWKYEDGTDLAYFDGLNETILSVGLVKPKPGIFQPHIQYLLCLATPVDIVLLGVSFARPYEGSSSDPGFGEMHLLPDPLFSIPTDSTYIMSIAGATNGRIFMAGKDGCLYELAYQAEDGWFSRKCRKINHSTSKLSFLVPSVLNFSFSEDDSLVQICIDNSRNILYARSEKGTIQVFDLGADGKGMSRITSVSQNYMLQAASYIAKTVERSNFKSIVYISAITKSESSNIHLVAITQTGVRLYFATNPFGAGKNRPSGLTLVHVRLPPGFSASATAHPPNNIHMACHRKGTLILVSSQNEDNDVIWAISGESLTFQKQLMESQTKWNDLKTWAICEVPVSKLHSKFSDKKLQNIRADPPPVVTQHVEPPRKFVILSAQGSHILRKLRPVEQLQQLLVECQGPDSEQVKSFFRLHKVDHACATCLVLACSRNPSDHQVADWARMAFFMYGGEAQYNFSMPTSASHLPANIGPGGFMPGPMGSYIPVTPSSTVVYSPTSHNTSFAPFATPMPGMQPAHMSTPAPGYQQSFYQHGVSSFPTHMQEILFSGKHNGICIYLGRILRPFWDSLVCMEFPCQTPQGMVSYLTSSFNSEELSVALELIRDLSDFVDFNSRFDSGGPVDSMMPVHLQSRIIGQLDEQTKKKLHSEAQRMEKISLQHIQDLLHRVEEDVGLWKVLVDHQFHIIASALTKDQQNQLRSMSFKQLVITGKEICGSLITCLINRYLDDNATIDAISTKLREVCPSLYSTDDATCSKANELLQAAKTNPNQLEKKKQLQEALKRYKDVTTPLQLPAVCNQFASVNFYEGIVDLCLMEARKADPHDLASHFYQSGEPPEDTQGMQAYIHRMECYKCITETLGFLWSASVSHPQAPSVPKSPGPQAAPDPTRVVPAYVEQYRTDILQLALKSDDALFHSALYDWLFMTNNTEKLLEIQTPFVEPYLRRKTQLNSDNVGALDMLWKYYEKIQNFPAASRILCQLAERLGLDVPLQQRIEYLSRSIMCAKSSTSRISSAAGGEFLHELEEKMEVARLQLKVHKALSKLAVTRAQIPEVQEAMSRLDSELVDITSLYEDFADRFDLSECKLAIVHCAGLYDGALIESLWQNIIDKEVSSTASSASQVRVTNISNRLIAIAKTYVNTERYFPVAFIIRYLEQRSCELNFDTKWVFRVLLEIGVQPAKLLEIYDRMFKSRDPYWQTIKKPLHLLLVLHDFLSHFANNPTLVPVTERRRFSTVSLDAVSSYLVDLQAMSSTDNQVRALTQHFKQLQAKLERM